MKNAHYGALKKSLGGLIACYIAFQFWLYVGGNPLHDFLLLRSGVVADGHIVNTWENVDDDDDGRAVWTHGAEYKFWLPNGKEITAKTLERSGRLKEDFANLTEPYPIKVEYYPNDPTISRIKGDGSTTLTEWLWRKAGLGGGLLALFLSPGVALLIAAYRELRNDRAMRHHVAAKNPDDVIAS